MDNLEIITTADGSHSLLNKTLNETYHSHHGAIQESVHVFINKGLQFLIDSFSPKSINIFEVGFGTGLNALLTLQFATQSNVSVSYTSIEAFPLERDVWSKLNYGATIGLQDQLVALHEADWNTSIDIHPNFKMLKLKTTLQDFSHLGPPFNLIFFDAFAPNKQPEMWELPILKKVVQIMTTPAVFVTYCAKGQLKRDLRTLGLQVETLEGPPGKKEMVRGLQM